MSQKNKQDVLTVRTLVEKLLDMIRVGDISPDLPVFVGDSPVKAAEEIQFGFGYKYTPQDSTYSLTDLMFREDDGYSEEPCWTPGQKHWGIWIK